ncbi:hypothetical protein GTZ85_32230 [Streptomyces sp. SID5474]|nr:hypothetical protein [Streptomyces sp. SID5474]
MRSTLADWGWDEDRVASAVLVVSELLTNAQLHTDGEVVLTLRRTRRGVRLSVADTDPRMPTRRDTGPNHEGGFGLHILDTITTGWGVRTRRAGKTVWADIDAFSPLASHLARRSDPDGTVSAIRAILRSRWRAGPMAARRRVPVGLPAAEVWRRVGAVGTALRVGLPATARRLRHTRRPGAGLMLVNVLTAARPSAA